MFCVEGVTLHARFARKYLRPAPGVQAPRSSGEVTEPDFATPAACEAGCASCVAHPKRKGTPFGVPFRFGGATRIRTGDEGFADPCLTTWPWRRWSGLRGSNPPPRPWQGRALPNELNPQWCLRSESNQRHGDFQSPALPTELQRRTARAVCITLKVMATRRGLEPLTSSVTG